MSGGPPDPPPRPPKRTARDLFDPGEPGRKIFVGDYIEVAGFSDQLGLKPFLVVAELLDMRIFRHYDEFIDFATAVAIARKHGFVVERLL
jgi:translation initiation factor IF-2